MGSIEKTKKNKSQNTILTLYIESNLPVGIFFKFSVAKLQTFSICAKPFVFKQFIVAL